MKSSRSKKTNHDVHPGPLPMMTGAKDPLEMLLRHYLDGFIAGNHAAQIVRDGLKVLGVGFRPMVDHITFRTLDIGERAREFLKFGYVFDAKLGIVEYSHWWAKIFRKAGYPSISIGQAFAGKRKRESSIPDWVHTFGDEVPHHVAIQVDDIEQAVYFLEKQGVRFASGPVGEKGSDLRWVFTEPELKKGKAFSVLELTERHRGYAGFLSE